jgi:hypothetical protein
MKRTALIMVIALVIATIVNAQTRVEVKTTDLPKAISDKVAADYAGYVIQNVFKVTKDNQTTFQLLVSKGSEKEKLDYNANGTFIKKEPVKQALAANTTSKKSSSKKSSVTKAPATNTSAVKAPVTKTPATNAPAQKTPEKK